MIGAVGATSLVAVGRHYFLEPSGGASGPELQYNGAAFVAGQFGTWAPIGAEQTASGYEIAWKVPGADLYTVWTTSSSGNFVSNMISSVSGTSNALESIETSFHQDLNGDGTIGPPITIGATGAGNGTDLLDFSHLAIGNYLATGGANTGTLDPTHFVSNSDGHASGIGAQFIYNTTSHILSFDSDGTGGTSAIQMARLENSAPLTFSDIHLV